jgi:hypothetical protein
VTTTSSSPSRPLIGDDNLSAANSMDFTRADARQLGKRLIEAAGPTGRNTPMTDHYHQAEEWIRNAEDNSAKSTPALLAAIAHAILATIDRSDDTIDQ